VSRPSAPGPATRPHAVPDADLPADPYPGRTPPWSFAHLDELAHPLVPDPRAGGGWRLGARGPHVDAWLAGHGASPLAGRLPVLTYGSNRCPSKITWLRRTLGLRGPVVALRARTEDVAAVWAHGLRHRDGRRPAVLAAAAGRVEEHTVWLATPEQIAVLDRCEGRGDRYRLVRLRTGRVRTEDGALVEAPWCYLGHAAIRQPLLVDGRPVRCADLAEPAARDLRGDPAPDDGLDSTPVDGPPHPDEWPASLFVYGLLQPGRRSWSLVARHAAGPPRPVTVAGSVHDTGRGYPALLPGDGRVPGWVVPLRDPATALPGLDRYEGPEYARVRLTVPSDGTVSWVYLWRSATADLVPLPAGWPGR
jgi:gamma-glutamylcyclotransferase (GGCT)/AIG2-like uncharacterized protein YtfP